MVASEEKSELAKKMGVIWIIWGSLFLSLFIYILVCHLVAGQLDSKTMEPDFPMSLFTNILFAIAMLELIITFVLRRFMLGSSMGISGNNQTAITSAAGKYTVIVMISCTICESIGIYGLVVFFLSQNYQMLYAFMFISAVSMLYFRPKMNELERLHGTIAKILKQD